MIKYVTCFIFMKSIYFSYIANITTVKEKNISIRIWMKLGLNNPTKPQLLFSNLLIVLEPFKVWINYSDAF